MPFSRNYEWNYMSFPMNATLTSIFFPLFELVPASSGLVFFFLGSLFFFLTVQMKWTSSFIAKEPTFPPPPPSLHQHQRELALSENLKLLLSSHLLLFSKATSSSTAFFLLLVLGVLPSGTLALPTFISKAVTFCWKFA